MLRKVCAIALIAVSVSACCSSRSVVKESSDRVATYEQRDSVKEEVMVAVHDTIMETTTITIRENEQGDTLRVSTVTDRLRARDRNAIAVQRTKTEVKVDTVYVEKRDSVSVKNTNLTNPTNRPSGFILALRWIFWIIVAVIALVIVVRIRGRP